MVLSNEPGYYVAGEFGIRQENLIRVIEHNDSYLGFDNLTYIPFDKRLIDPTLLSEIQLEWLNQYHQSVWRSVSAYLPCELQDWLADKCAPLKRDSVK